MSIIRDPKSEPYYDYTEDELAKGYVSVLAVPGRPLQNREVNSISGLIYGNLKKITDVIIENGTILSGCNFVKDDSDSDNIKCILSPGNIYFNGLSIDLNIDATGKTWSYNTDPLLSDVPHGYAILCVEVVPYGVTDLEDTTLVDPAENYESYGVAGAHRLKYYANPSIMSETDFAKVSSTNKNLVSIMRLYDGEIIGPTKPKPVFGLIRNWIAQRTYDEAGNYIARGLRVEVHSSESLQNANKEYTLHISPGKVYMEGYDYFYDNKTIITSKSAIDTFSTGNVPESHEYKTGTDTYALNNKHVSSIDNIVGEVEITAIPVRARLNTDEIPDEYTPVSSVTRMYKKNADGTITVIPESLYYIDSNRKIVWTTPISMSEYRPALNTTYYIDIVKSDNFVVGKDYVLDEDSIKFINVNKKPRADRSFYIYYSWYVSRIDLLYIDEEGSIQLINGIPNDEMYLEEPKAPAGSLTLSSIKVMPGVVPESYTIKNFHVMRIPISEIKSIKNRVDNIEYSIAMSQLESEAQDKHTSRENIISLSNIFTDSFDNLTKSDIGNFLTECSIDVFSSELKLPIRSTNIGIRDIKIYDTAGEKIDSPYIMMGRISDTVAVDWQNYASETIDLNQYNFVKQKPEISITPGFSIYYDSTLSYNNNVFVPTKIFYSYKTLLDWWRDVNDNFYDDSNNTSNIELNNQKISGLRDLDVPYLVSETIDITGLNFPPNTEIEMYVDDKKVYAYSTDGTYSDEVATNGNLKTNSEGYYEGSFELPKGLSSESHIVTAKTLTGDYQSITTFDGKIELNSLKMFTSTSKQDQTSPAVYLRNYNANYNDPIAQSVKMSTDIFSSAIDVYFQSKPDSGYVFFTIRRVDNGVPGNTVLYEKMIPSDDIVVSSSNSSSPTKIVFDYPIYFAANTEYCFTFGSDKIGYKMWLAKIGGTDKNTGTKIKAKNHNGTFFQGSGSGAWTPVNDSMLTFTLYRSVFNASSTYYTEAITSDIGNFALLNISADYAKLADTDIKVYYAINIDDTEVSTEDNWQYLPLEECIKITSKSSYNIEGMKIRFRFILTTANSRISPVINLNSLAIILGKYNIKGNYLSRTISI